MEDRELLELAAKAAMRAGMSLECPDDPDGVYVARPEGRVWNPMTDNSDALRLMVDLNLEVERNDYGNRFYVGAYGQAKWMEDSDDHWDLNEDKESARMAAFRRAIVCAIADMTK